MDLYTKTSYELSRTLTLRYSTSFGTSTKQFSKSTQAAIFALYGLVRIADEIVDTYQGADQAQQLDELETEVYRTLKTGYSTNPIVHAFCHAANEFGITKTLIAPFFKSMRLDLTEQTYTQKQYEAYIYGSAEVIGLMCLKVFIKDNDKAYTALSPGARALGAAYQKVNFLRDLASDYHERSRVYFPGVTFATFSEEDKQAIIADIERDVAAAKDALRQLPPDARRAVGLSLAYYGELVTVLKATSVDTIKSERIRVPDSKKAVLFAKHALTKGATWQK